MHNVECSATALDTLRLRGQPCRSMEQQIEDPPNPAEAVFARRP